MAVQIFKDDTMLRYLCVPVLTLGLMPHCLAADYDLSSEIVGIYNCTGNDAIHKPSAFNSILTITKQGQQYIMSETVTQGSKTFNFNQVGIRHGNTMAIAFQRSDDFKAFGTGYFTISNDGKHLSANFATWGQLNKIGSTTCERSN